MRRILLVGVGLFVLVSGFRVVDTVSAAQTSTTEDHPAVKAIYESKCATCHGADGKGSPIGKALQTSDLSSKAVQSSPDDVLVHSISAGKGKMPAFGKVLDEQEIRSLVVYLRSFDAAPPPASSH